MAMVKLGDNFTFYANTFTPSTGAAVDADAAPGYRVYEDETGTPLLTGNMALIDDANTTGFYSEQIACTSANGFEAGKCYCVRITGVVATVTGVALVPFQVTANDVDDLALASTALTNVTWSDARAAKLDNLDAAVSSRSTYAGGAVASVTGAVGSVTGAVGSVTAGVTVTTNNDKTGYSLSTAPPTAAAIADAIADEALSGHTTAGTAGKAWSDAGAAGDPWAAAVRTLTVAAVTVGSGISGSTLTIIRGDSLSASITGLGSIAARTKLWFTVKSQYGDADTASVVQIEETGGLLYLNGAAGTAANGDITVDDEDDGDITITLAAASTATLTAQSGLVYDVQMLTATGVQTLATGSCAVTADITRAVS